MRPAPTAFWIVDAIKAIASQLIVWHHFAAYGPLARTVHPYAAQLMDWLYADARQAVQAFLVLGGFLAARSLAPRPHAPCFDTSARGVAQLVWRRYVRLVRPYAVVLLLAIAAAALARQILNDVDTPAVPALLQLLAHILLIHDIVDVNSLSAGVWYVAIDFQLYVVLLLLLWLAQVSADRYQVAMRWVALLAVVGLIASSLLWFNRNPAMDEWALYFFGAYGLGVMVQWSSGLTRKHFWLTMVFSAVILALALEWRSRLVVALFTALILSVGLHVKPVLNQRVHDVVAWLSRISYSVFLIHYPIILLIGSIFARLWPHHVEAHIAGLLAAWLLSLAGGAVLYQQVERTTR